MPLYSTVHRCTVIESRLCPTNVQLQLSAYMTNARERSGLRGAVSAGRLPTAGARCHDSPVLPQTLKPYRRAVTRTAAVFAVICCEIVLTAWLSPRLSAWASCWLSVS